MIRFCPKDNIFVQMDDISEKNDKIRISIFQTIFISKIILKCQMLVQNSKNQVDMVFYSDRPDFEMSQLARTPN